MRKKNKNLCKEHERRHRNRMTAMLLSIEGKKPEEFWNLDFAIPPEMWLHHFNSLLNDGEDTPLNFINELASFENKPRLSLKLILKLK